MARYKPVDRSPKFIPVVLDAQIQPGSFEYVKFASLLQRRANPIPSVEGTLRDEAAHRSSLPR